jgi:D-alanyl-D-alanine carboxypeptidase (penicillin-binding protein 5/6)
MESGSIWMNMNGDDPMPPGSMSKLMTEMIVLNQISSARSRWDDKVPISAYASTVGGITLFLQRGESYTVRELFEGPIEPVWCFFTMDVVICCFFLCV